jgi:hypothetical protein
MIIVHSKTSATMLMRTNFQVGHWVLALHTCIGGRGGEGEGEGGTSLPGKCVGQDIPYETGIHAARRLTMQQARKPIKLI